MGHSRIPETLPKYNVYIVNADNHLNSIPKGESIKRGLTLGLNAEDLNQLNKFRRQWRTDDSDKPGVYEIHTNPQTKGKYSRINVLNHMNEFGKFFRPLLNIISANLKITSNDRLILNITQTKSKYKRRTSPIKEGCFPTVRHLGGSWIEFGFRSEDSSSRPKKPEGASAVEIAYRLDPPPSGNENKHLISNPEDGTTKIYYTKAIFPYEFGEDNIGCYLQYYCHWINHTHPNLNGPWTGPFYDFIF